MNKLNYSHISAILFCSYYISQLLCPKDYHSIEFRTCKLWIRLGWLYFISASSEIAKFGFVKSILRIVLWRRDASENRGFKSSPGCKVGTLQWMLTLKTCYCVDVWEFVPTLIINFNAQQYVVLCTQNVLMCIFL
jgi:hypothetical protein